MNTEYKEDIDLADEEIRKTLYYLDTNVEVLYMSHNIPQFRNLPNSKIENDRMCDYFVREHHDNMINFNTGAYGIDYPEQDFFLNQLAYLIHKGTIVTEKDKISYFLNKVISANWALKKGDIVLSENGTIRKISDTSNNRQIKGILNYIINNLYSDVKQYLQSSFDTLADLKAIRSTENIREKAALSELIPEANGKIAKVLSFMVEHKSELFREICLPTEDSDLTAYEEGVLDSIHNRIQELNLSTVKIKSLSDDTERFVGSYFIYHVVCTKDIVSKKDITNYFIGDKEYIDKISEDGLIESVTGNRGCISYLYDIIDDFCGNTITDLSNIIEITRLADNLNHNIRARKGIE